MQIEQRIEIRNFGPIKNVSLQVKDFMVFIGPQASGKSTIAKAIYFFKSLKQILASQVLYNYITSSVYDDVETAILKCKRVILKNFLSYFPKNTNDRVVLEYFYEQDIWVSIVQETDKKHLTVYLSDKLKDKMGKLLAQCLTVSCSLSEMLKDFNIDETQKWNDYNLEQKKQWEYIKKRYNEILKYDIRLIFIPAGRSAINAIKWDAPQILDLTNNRIIKEFFDNVITPLRMSFGKSLNEFVENVKHFKKQIDENKVKIASDLVRNVLKGEYKYEQNNEERIYFADNQYVPLNTASSGQQESLWILLLLFEQILYERNKFIIIEEPEAHLFPDAQKDIVNLMALFSNIQNAQLIITTHSPYILASINNLMYAHKVGSQHKEKVAEKINEHLWLDVNKVYAGFVSHGEIENIIDPELNLIQQERIDTISSIINDEFDFLFQLETD